MLLPSNLLKTAAALCSRLSLASRSASQHVKVGIYHGLQLPKRRDDETNLAFTKRKEMIKEAQIAERERTQREFKERKITIVVATEAFGMGINNPCVHRGCPLISCCLLTSFSPMLCRRARRDIRRVIQIGPPKMLEALINMWGRAGRDGMPSECTLMAQPKDFNAHVGYTYLNERTNCIDSAGKQRLDASLAAERRFFNNVTDCRWKLLMAHYEEGAHEDSTINDPSWRCGKCDNCTRSQT